MSHLLFWRTVTYFYPIGNTSAVCLTENLPPENNADILLLACGDPRHILYTIYINEASPSSRLRAFDITCCDVDAAVLARNALLFSFLADNQGLRLDSLWDLFYHMFIDKHTLLMLSEQCRKLIPLAENTETWKAGPYGHFLTTCDAATLAQLRNIWTTYLDTANLSHRQTKRFEQRFIDGMHKMGNRGTTDAARSAGPLSLHALPVVIRQFSGYWSSGTTTTDGTHGGKSKNSKRNLRVNPTFAFSIDGDEFSVYYASDPLSGFHLAEAFVSGKAGNLCSPHELVRIAKDQFSRWCTSMSKRLQGCNPSSSTFAIRMYAGDALSFCQALKYSKVTRSAMTPYDVAPWRMSTITLDDCYYGRNARSPAPLSFDVIDTSNVLDHVGLLNILVVTAPLLHKSPAATLYTEALLRVGNNPSQAILEHLCGDLPTMALLLGVVPSTFISQFSTRSNVHEALGTNGGEGQYHERLTWKAVGLGGHSVNAPALSQRLCFPLEDLAAFLFRVYRHMFSDENVMSRLQLLPLSPERMVRELQRSGLLHYNRRSFALLLHWVKTRVHTEWQPAMDHFQEMVLADTQLIMGQHAYQELCCQLHLLGVYTARLFRDWTRDHVPQSVTLTLVVPREAIGRLEPDFVNVGTPVLQCDMDDGPRQNWFAVTSATFGTLRISGTGEHRVGVVIPPERKSGADAMQPPWRTGAPLIITFSILSSTLMDFMRNTRATVGLTLRPTMGVTSKFGDDLGFNLTVFRTHLVDTERVFVLARRPVVGTQREDVPTTVGGAVVTGHWQEDMPAASSVKASMDVSVQMNDMASAVRSFTVRIDIADPDARTALADVQTVLTISSGSGSPRSLNVYVKIGTHTYPVRFPLPVDASRARLRVARRSFYIEVVAPLAPAEVVPERDLSGRFVSLDYNDNGTPTLGSIHRVNLDRCPVFVEPPKNLSTLDWFDVHVGSMFSKSERLRAIHANKTPSSTATGSISESDALVHVKQTLQLLLRAAAGVNTDGKAPGRTFALFDTSHRARAPYLYIVVARTCLDVGSHTVVADVFVALGTPAAQAAPEIALHGGTFTSDACRGRPPNPDDMTIRYIGTNADGAAAWLHLVPCLVERCRTWLHKTTCAYRTRQKHDCQVKPLVQGGERGSALERLAPLCACGLGVGTEILPKQFERAAPLLTRAAFSPLFSVPYLEEVGVGVDNPPTTRARTGSRCRLCGDEGGMTCSRCKRAWYCSARCQRADWKVHKKDCNSAVEKPGA